MTEAPIADTREIIGGLLRPAACIAPKYFYDARGSLLFEEITQLPEYYPTRTERAIMQQHGAEIAGKVGAGATVIEMGAGSCEKARDLCELIRPALFVAVDISAEFLHQAADGLRAAFPELDIRVLAADLTAEMSMPSDLSLQHRLVFYPGSSIGNFDPPQALSLLSRFRRLLGEDGALLIGVDLLNDPDALLDRVAPCLELCSALDDGGVPDRVLNRGLDLNVEFFGLTAHAHEGEPHVAEGDHARCDAEPHVRVELAGATAAT